MYGFFPFFWFAVAYKFLIRPPSNRDFAISFFSSGFGLRRGQTNVRKLSSAREVDRSQESCDRGSDQGLNSLRLQQLPRLRLWLRLWLPLCMLTLLAIGLHDWGGLLYGFDLAGNEDVEMAPSQGGRRKRRRSTVMTTTIDNDDGSNDDDEIATSQWLSTRGRGNVQYVFFSSSFPCSLITPKNSVVLPFNSAIRKFVPQVNHSYFN